MAQSAVTGGDGWKMFGDVPAERTDGNAGEAADVEAHRIAVEVAGERCGVDGDRLAGPGARHLVVNDGSVPVTGGGFLPLDQRDLGVGGA